MQKRSFLSRLEKNGSDPQREGPDHETGMLLAGIGAGAGLLTALLLARFLESLLYGVHPEDPFILGGVPLTLFLAATVATYIPARRATRVNPIDSLRSE